MNTAALATDARASAPNAQEALLARHYEEFRRLARKVLNGDGALVRMQPTELAHEAAIRVMGLHRIDLRDRAHFLALSATVMRQTLIDEVRRARAGKRQAPGVLTMWPRSEEGSPVDVEALDEALKALAAVSPERARVVELRFFAGLTVEEIAGQTGESESTVKRRWRAARAWLLERLQG
ncbi:MAG TPA: ECF-type sigma factor [Caulobacteraceae bacterium]|jgi:RNA polymerase sigma factor (TIGR02999 family)